MPRKRERTTTKASWTVETLEKAIEKLRRGGASVYNVSQETGIPYSTLKKRFKLAKSNNTSYKCPPKLGRPSVFTEEQEATLADHLREMSRRFYGLTRAQFCKICYTMAEKFGVAGRFNEANKTAGRDFVTGFLRRHSGLTIRKPEATSINRILGFNKVEVDRFFGNLEKVMTKHHFPPSHIYNMDETGVTTVQKSEKIIAPKGLKRVGGVTSWERGKNVTVLCAMSATGSFIPPLFVFPRKRHSPQLEKDGPPGAVYTCSHNGWTNEIIYIKWLRHFIEHSKPTAEKPVLLIMDNHSSHCTLEAWEVAKANNIVVLSIPPHSSHRLQPLDVTFFGPLKKAYNKECDMFIKSRNMVKITPYEIAGLFNNAYARVASLDKGTSGFKATGIVPMNPAVFTEEDFVAVDEDQNQVNKQASLQDSLTVNSAPTFPSTANILQEQLPDIDRATSPSVLNGSQEEASTTNDVQEQPLCTDPTTSNDTQRQSDNLQTVTVNFDQTSACPITAEKSNFSDFLSVVSPLPNISNKNKTSRQKQHSVILTSTPMKTVFEEKKQKRLEKNSKTKTNPKKKGKTTKKQENKENNIQKNTGTCNKKNCAKGKCAKGKCTVEKGKKRKTTTIKEEKVKRVKKKIFADESDTSEEEDIKNLCEDESEYSEEEALCAICCDTGKSNEMWYRCRGCGKWAHQECSGLDSAVDYICVFCLDP